MSKQLFSLLLVLAMLVTAFAGSAMAEGVSGTWESTAQGFAGDVTVSLTLEDGVITAMTADGPAETEGLGKKACVDIPAAVVASGSLAVDGMTGATFSSTAIFEAAKDCLTQAGVNPDDYMTEVAKEAAEDAVYDADVAIVGAGGAGMIAALTAADAGKTVVIVESQGMAGGNSIKSTGGMNAAKTPSQDENEFNESAGVEKTLETAAASWADNETITALAQTVKEPWDAWQADPQGYFDSTELMQLDTMIGGKGINDPELVKALCEGSADAIEWLKSVNINLSSVGAFGGASVKRIHRPLNDEGKVVSVGSYVVPLLEAAIGERENITLLFNTTANEILVKDGAAVGIAATGATGENVTVNAGAVVLAAGGFGANLEMVSSYKPELDGFMTTNAPGVLGQGILMAEKIGAATVDMEQIQIHPTVQADTASLITEGLRGDGAILVNAEGVRFIDEVGTRDVVSAAEIAQPGSFSWLIVDDAMLQASSVIQGYVNRGFVFSGDTYEALAEAIDVPADAFAATMNSWNEKVAAREDADFGRVSFANPLDTAPFYAIKVTAGIHHTMGGLKINTAAEVQNTEGASIPGLFAAGEITGGVHGANRLGGNAVADFSVFGRIAGASAAAYVG